MSMIVLGNEDDGSAVAITLEHIEAMYPNGEKTRLLMTSGNQIIIEIPMKELIAKMEQNWEEKYAD